MKICIVAQSLNFRVGNLHCMNDGKYQLETPMLP